jgi:hypothetical protein
VNPFAAGVSVFGSGSEGRFDVVFFSFCFDSHVDDDDGHCVRHHNCTANVNAVLCKFQLPTYCMASFFCGSLSMCRVSGCGDGVLCSSGR